MNGFETDYSAMTLHKIREQQLTAQTENERNVRSLREEIVYHVRRAVRINNNPKR